jgi:5-methylcytosine-specific restriction enzyme A
MISELLSFIMENYISEKQSTGKVVTQSPIFEKVTSELPSFIRENVLLNANYKVKGSIGELNFNMAHVPWIAVFDKSITTSAKRGYYIVLLFKADMSGCYLTLNQGFDQYRILYGTEANEAISRNSIKAQQLISPPPGFNTQPIFLESGGGLATGYCKGNIFSKYYDRSSPPSDTDFISDLNLLLYSYSLLKEVVGDSIIHMHELDGKEDAFQEAIQTIDEYNEIDGAEVIPELAAPSESQRYIRDTKRSALALKKANYQCEFNNQHQTFIHGHANHQYTEGHHCIPLSFQPEFSCRLDVVANIISLCPTCHRAIHHGSEQLKIQMITNLFSQRQEALITKGIITDLSKLLSYYIGTSTSEMVEQE